MSVPDHHPPPGITPTGRVNHQLGSGLQGVENAGRTLIVPSLSSTIACTSARSAAAPGASAPSVSRLRRRLVDHGLIDRTAAESNAINLRLSPTGRDTLRRVNASRLAQLKAAGDSLPTRTRMGTGPSWGNLPRSYRR